MSGPSFMNRDRSHSHQTLMFWHVPYSEKNLVKLPTKWFNLAILSRVLIWRSHFTWSNCLMLVSKVESCIWGHHKGIWSPKVYTVSTLFLISLPSLPPTPSSLPTPLLFLFFFLCPFPFSLFPLPHPLLLHLFLSLQTLLSSACPKPVSWNSQSKMISSILG